MRTQVLAVLTLALLFILPAMVMAVDLNQSISPQDKATFDQILAPVMKVYNLVKYIASAIAAIALLIAGITYMVSGNDPRSRDNAKNMAMYIIIGLIVILAAPMIVNLLIG